MAAKPAEIKPFLGARTLRLLRGTETRANAYGGKILVTATAESKTNSASRAVRLTTTGRRLPALSPVSLKVQAAPGTYPEGIRITDKDMKAFETEHPQRHQFHDDWNSSITALSGGSPTRSDNPE